MPALIRPNRAEISRTFPLASFTIRTGKPAWYELVVATDPKYIYGSTQDAAQRTPANFWSSRSLGFLPSQSDETVFLLPPSVVDRFVGHDKLYYGIALYNQQDWRNPEVKRLPLEAVPFVRISASFTGSERGLFGLNGHRRGLTGDLINYGAESPTSLVWGGDTAVPGEMVAITPTNGNGAHNGSSVRSTNGSSSESPPASDSTATQQGYALAYDDGYDNTFWSKPQQHDPIETIAVASLGGSKQRMPTPQALSSDEIPLDPGIGGRSVGTAALYPGDIILTTTDQAISRAIRVGSGGVVSHTVLYIGNGRVVEAVGEGVVEHTLETALSGATLAVAFRYPNLTEEQERAIVEFALAQVGKSYNYVGVIRQLPFQYHTSVCDLLSGDARERCRSFFGNWDLGAHSENRYFCSELVVAAYQAANVPLTSTPPNWTTPQDLAELRLNLLLYVGHLFAQPIAQGQSVSSPYSVNGNHTDGKRNWNRSFGARALGQAFDVNWTDVELVPQMTGMSCWAAAAAMIVGWRDMISINPEEIARGAGFWAEYASGLYPRDHDDLGRAWGLVMEPPQSYSVDGLRRLLETNGPLWVGVSVPSGHAIVVSGLYGDGTANNTRVRILDPWPVGQGARYELDLATFVQQYEDRLTVDSAGNINAQILHAGGRQSQQQSYQRPRTPKYATAQVAPVVVEIGSVIAGATMERILSDEGDLRFELDQLRGLKHPFDDPSKSGPGDLQTHYETFKGPHASTVLGLDEIYADIEVRWQTNGRSVGNLTITPGRDSSDAAGAGLKVTARLLPEGRTFLTEDRQPMAGIPLEILYQFTNVIRSDIYYKTEIMLYGNGRHSVSYQW